MMDTLILSGTFGTLSAIIFSLLSDSLYSSNMDLLILEAPGSSMSKTNRALTFSLKTVVISGLATIVELLILTYILT